MKKNIKKTLNLEAFKISKLTNHMIIMGGIYKDDESPDNGDGNDTVQNSSRKCLFSPKD